MSRRRRRARATSRGINKQADTDLGDITRIGRLVNLLGALPRRNNRWDIIRSIRVNRFISVGGCDQAIIICGAGIERPWIVFHESSTFALCGDRFLSWLLFGAHSCIPCRGGWHVAHG